MKLPSLAEPSSQTDGGGRVPLGTLYGFQMSQTDGGGFQGRVPPPEFEMIAAIILEPPTPTEKRHTTFE